MAGREDAFTPVFATVLLTGMVFVLVSGVWVITGGFVPSSRAVEPPLLVLRDASDPCTTGVDDDLFTVDHRAGSDLLWTNVALRVLDGATVHTSAIDWGGAAIGELPSAPFGPGARLTAAEETTDVCTNAALESWVVQLIDLSQDVIVYEEEVQIR